MQANLKVDMTGALSKVSVQNRGRGQRAMINQAWSDMLPYAPMKSGDLRTASSISQDAKSITFNMPYASAQYRGIVKGGKVKRYTTPGTGKLWDKRAYANHGEDWKQAYVRGASL